MANYQNYEDWKLTTLLTVDGANIPKHTKKEQAMIMAYLNAKIGETVSTVYNKPSGYKLRAEMAIMREMADNGGFRYKVTGHNSSFFTCAYIVLKNGDAWLITHTYANRYETKLF